MARRKAQSYGIASSTRMRGRLSARHMRIRKAGGTRMLFAAI
jgi:hypothetical protein